MSTEYLAITPHDPIIARDGRPFGKNQGIRMRSLDWPYPSVLTGTLRTMLGKMKGGFSDEVVKELLKIDIAGPLPMKGMQLYFPIPKDLLVKKAEGKSVVIPLRPPARIEDGEGCDLPKGDLLPTMLPGSVDEDFKPEKLPAFWSMCKMIEWLASSDGSGFFIYLNPNTGQVDECKDAKPDFLESPEKDERVHTGISPETGVAAVEEGLLFMSVGLDLSTKERDGGIRLAAKVESSGVFETLISKLDQMHPFGGERRLAQWSRTEKPNGWTCPEKLKSKISRSNKIRMVLATPAIFSKGWLPGWMKDVDGCLKGTPPGAPDSLKLRLVSACVDRWRPISGWSAEAESRGPKAVRRLVPAGSVYFFEAEQGGDTNELAENHWLKSVCDVPQDCRDGFGLTVWGIWEEAKNEEINDKR